MKLQILKEEIKIRVRKDDDLKLLLSKANGVKVASVDRWLREDNVILTTVTNLNLIKTHFSLPDSEPLTEEKEVIPA